jgi:hypothetical protein
VNRFLALLFLATFASGGFAAPKKPVLRAQKHWALLIPSNGDESYVLTRWKRANGKVGYSIMHARGMNVVTRQAVTEKTATAMLKQIQTAKAARRPAAFCERPYILRETNGKTRNDLHFCAQNSPRLKLGQLAEAFRAPLRAR